MPVKTITICGWTQCLQTLFSELCKPDPWNPFSKNFFENSGLCNTPTCTYWMIGVEFCPIAKYAVGKLVQFSNFPWKPRNLKINTSWSLCATVKNVSKSPHLNCCNCCWEQCPFHDSEHGDSRNWLAIHRSHSWRHFYSLFRMLEKTRIFRADSFCSVSTQYVWCWRCLPFWKNIEVDNAASRSDF